ncbi:glycosyltransferase [Calothrix sp. UHCC 0171]|uniref:glycosyltransferase n=1 Tax=Calothrix sp. UHCC 0171 TaxID=3110245 RepID=UPI002B21BFAD|nr:glycosyltransferase [Calothrix sp. UHCC 0171]MEA5569985.1 glycosyltransferase [Calothrix sp. UHCC 0171]
MLIKNSSHQIYVLFPDLRIAGNCSNYLLLNPKDKSIKRINLNYPVTSECYRHEELSAKFTSLMTGHQIDVVHFFHLIKYPLNLPLIAQLSGAKTVISFFDYYFICPQFNFLKKDNHFCDYPHVSIQTCDLCLKQRFNYQANTQHTRQSLISEVLYHTNAVHYLCSDQRSRMVTAYPHLQTKLSLTMGLGLDAQPQPQIDTKFVNYLAPLKVACVGNFDTNKGAELLLQVIDYYQSIKQQNIEFHIYGDTRHPYSTVLYEMAKQKTVKSHGSYTPEQLPKLLRECHIAVFASIWPETFVLALSEAWSCGLIPVAPKLGAFGERINHGKNGFIYDYKDPGSLIKILDSFLSFTKQDFLDLLEGVSQVKYPSLQSNLDNYLSLYNRIHKTASDINSVEILSRLVIDVHPESWHSDSKSSSTISVASGNKEILQKAWQFYRREGLRSTINRFAKYANSKIK